LPLASCLLRAVENCKLMAERFNRVAEDCNLMTERVNRAAEDCNLMAERFNQETENCNLIAEGFNRVAEDCKLMAELFNRVAEDCLGLDTVSDWVYSGLFNELCHLYNFLFFKGLHKHRGFWEKENLFIQVILSS